MRRRVFCFVEADDPRGCEGALAKATVNEATYLHVFDDGSGSELEYARHAEEKTFSEAYRNRTQRHWAAFWPREVRPRAKHAPIRFLRGGIPISAPRPRRIKPPVLHAWTAQNVGDVHEVMSARAHFHCVPEGAIELWTADALRACVAPPAADAEEEPAPPQSLHLTLRTLSVSPRIFLIEDLLSSAEVAHLVELGINKERSTTGNAAHQSETQPSKDTW